MSADSLHQTGAPDPGAGSSAQRESVARNGLGVVAGVALTGAIIAWVWHRHGIGLTALRHGAREADVASVALVFVLSAAFGLIVGAHKLHLVLRAMGVPIRYRETLQVRLASAPARLLLPFASGELMQVLCFRTVAGLPLVRASGAVVFDKGINFLGALCWLVIGAGLGLRGDAAPEAMSRAIPPLTGVLVIALLVGIGAVFATPAHGLAVRWGTGLHPKLGGWIASLLEPYRRIEARGKLTLLGYGVVFQARPLVVCYALLAALNVYPGFRAVMAASAAAVCAGYAPGFVAGSGPREAVLLELLRPAGVSPEAGFFVGALMTLSIHVVPAIVGVPWSLRMIGRGRPRAAGDATREAP